MIRSIPQMLPFAALLLASAAWGQVRFFDMGTADSKVYEGATRVTAADVYSEQRGRTRRWAIAAAPPRRLSCGPTPSPRTA